MTTRRPEEQTEKLFTMSLDLTSGGATGDFAFNTAGEWWLVVTGVTCADTDARVHLC